MSFLNSHIIQHQRFEIHTSSQEGALSLQNSISELYYQEVLPPLEKLFDRYSGPEEYLRLDSLKIELTNISSHELPKQFPRQFLSAIESRLRQLKKEEPPPGAKPARRFSKEEAVVGQFLFFLEAGRLPWWAPRQNIPAASLEKELSEAIAQIPGFFISEWTRSIKRNPAVMQRMVNQFSDSLLEFILEVFAVDKGIQAKTAALPQDTPPSPDAARNEHYTRAFQAIFRLAGGLGATEGQQEEGRKREKITESGFKIQDFVAQESFLTGEAELAPGAPAQLLPIPQKDGQTARQEIRKEEVDGIFIHHAGLPLLHPFLPPFFAACGLLDEAEQQFRDAASRERAIHLLYYAGAGRSEPPEFELPIHKLLCGVPLEAPVPRKLTLTRKEKAEAGRLLASVIEQWPALKNTDPPTFRDGFLQREGKLLRIDDGWKLIVETKAQDILLSRLPWGMGVIRLPWMREMVMVDWG